MHPFRKLIHISLGLADAFDKDPTPGEWAMMYRMAQVQTLTGVLFEGVRRLPAHQLPPPSILDGWQSLTEKIAAVHATHEQHARELEDILGRLGLHGCLLKGTSLSRLYPIPERRMCGDIDIWVKGTHDSILEAIEGAGYDIWGVLYQECKVEFFEDTFVEVHFHPSKMYNPWRNARLQRILESLSPIRDDAALTLPDARFNAVFCMAHMYRHYLEGGLGMRQMMDYYYILRILDPADRAPVMADLKRLGMGGFTAAMMLSLQFNFQLGNEYLLCPPDLKLGRKLIEDTIRMGNFGVLDARNRAKEGEGRIGRFLRKNKRVFSNLRHYPGEVLWSPFARVSQFVWRLFKGYL